MASLRGFLAQLLRAAINSRISASMSAGSATVGAISGRSTSRYRARRRWTVIFRFPSVIRVQSHPRPHGGSKFTESLTHYASRRSCIRGGGRLEKSPQRNPDRDRAATS